MISFDRPVIYAAMAACWLTLPSCGFLDPSDGGSPAATTGTAAADTTAATDTATADTSLAKAPRATTSSGSSKTGTTSSGTTTTGTTSGSTASSSTSTSSATTPTSTTSSSTPPASTSAVKPYGRDASLYGQITFQEEFDGTSVDTRKWQNKLWYLPDNPLRNYSVANGKLTMWAQKNSDGSWRLEQRELATDGTFYQRYGYWEARIKLPAGQGMWPSFWLYNHENGAARPEIDVMEAYSGGDPNGGWANAAKQPTNYGATIHEPSVGYSNGPRKLSESVAPAGIDLSADYHVYAVHWDAGGIQFFFDGKPLAPMATNVPFSSRMYVILGLWLGSASGYPNDSTPQSSSAGMEVDYVRVWALANGTTQTSGSAAP